MDDKKQPELMDECTLTEEELGCVAGGKMRDHIVITDPGPISDDTKQNV